jgi:predicted DNA-binding transcriptional regulator YafY
MKINRLLEITIILMNRGTITARELADRFGVSPRTIYRDIDVLSGAGVPVYTCKGGNGGIHLMEDYSLSKTIVNEHEADSLVLALKTLQATRYPELSTTLDKLGALFKRSSQNDWVRVDFSPWGSEPNFDDKFVNIKMAILNRKAVRFDYLSSLGEKTTRSVEPLQLVYKGQAWYLLGWCRSRDDMRMFRISRIKNLTLTQESFTPRSIEDQAETKAPSDAPQIVRAVLRFKPEIMHRVYDDYDEDEITRNADGSCDVVLTAPEDEWVYGYILSFGSYAEVMSPESLREKIIGRLERVLENYRRR